MTTTLAEPAVAYRGWPVLLLVDTPDRPRPGVKQRPQPQRATSWWEEAACRGQPKPDLFAGDGEPLKVAADRVRWFAERYCATCPVFDVCRAQPDEHGTWAGELRHRHKRLPLIPRAQYA